jgi:glycosyltransferase involved in cell wall biosynthesis
MSGRLRVTVVSRWYPLPGRRHQEGVFVRDQVRALAPACDVSVVVPEDAPARAVLAGRACTVDDDVRVVAMPGWPLALPARALVLWRALAEAAADVVHVHLLVPDALPSMFAARRQRVPIVVTEHAGYLTDLARSRRARFQIVQVLRGADAVIAPSVRLAHLLRTYEPGAHVEVIGNPVDTTLFRPDDASPRDIALSACLSLGEPKGTDVLLRAWARAAVEAELPQLVIVGGGPERSRFEALAHELGLGGGCEFVGQTTRNELATLMRRASLFVSASRTETFAGVVAEAIACGTPVVSTRVGGPDEYVTGQVGELVEPGDVDELASAVVRILRDASSYRPGALHRHVAARFGAEHVRGRLLALYRSLLAR